jgi:HAMP domain-containing protein
MPRSTLPVLTALSLSIVLVASCAEPPTKEISQAQGAIDAARAAGADRYAADALKGALDALKRSGEAVTAGDYRQALSYAIDSRDRAQDAAKQAVDTRATVQGEAERAITEVATLVDHLTARLKDPEVVRLPRRVIRDPQASLTSVTRSLQEARSAFEKGEYAKVAGALKGDLARLQAALTAIDSATARSPGR